MESEDEIREQAEIIRRFEGRGVLLFFTGRVVGSGTVISKASATAHLSTAYEGLVKSFEAPTRLEAARAAEAWWRDDRGGTVSEKTGRAASERSGGGTIDLAGPTDRIAEQGFSLIWWRSDDEPIIWTALVYDSHGTLIDLQPAKTPDDALLAVIEHLLPAE